MMKCTPCRLIPMRPMMKIRFVEKPDETFLINSAVPIEERLKMT